MGTGRAARRAKLCINSGRPNPCSGLVADHTPKQPERQRNRTSCQTDHMGRDFQHPAWAAVDHSGDDLTAQRMAASRTVNDQVIFVVTVARRTGNKPVFFGGQSTPLLVSTIPARPSVFYRQRRDKTHLLYDSFVFFAMLRKGSGSAVFLTAAG